MKPNLNDFFEKFSKDNSIKLLDLIEEDRERIKKLRRKALGLCVPNTHEKTAVNEWNKLFTEVKYIFEILENPNTAIETSKYDLTHEYLVSRESNEITETEIKKVTFTLDLPTICLPIQKLAQFTWELTDDNLAEINKKFEELTVEFINQLLKMRQPTIFDKSLFSSKGINDDLNLLNNGKRDTELTKKINALASSKLRFDEFDKDVEIHKECFMAFYKECFGKQDRVAEKVRSG